LTFTPTYRPVTYSDQDDDIERWESTREDGRRFLEIEDILITSSCRLEESKDGSIIKIKIAANDAKDKRAGNQSEVSVDVTKHSLCSGNQTLHACNRFRDLPIE